MSSRIFLPALSVAGALLAAPASGTLIITGVFDGPLSGGVPKAIELYVTADIADLSVYGVSSANNGGGPTGSPEFTFPADAATAGDYLYVADSENARVMKYSDDR